MKKLIIEARVNEYAMREDGNPNVPYTAEEIAAEAVACRAAGASIVHFHARKADGAPEHGSGAYARVVAAIRARSDVLIHPTLGYADHGGDPEARIRHIAAIAQDARTRPDLAPLDMGSLNVDRYNAQSRRYESGGRVYANSIDTLDHFAGVLGEAGVKPYLISWNIGFTRTAAAFLAMGQVARPALMMLVLTEGGYLGGHPGTPAGLAAHLPFIPEGVEWTVGCFGGNLFTVAAQAIAEGGHIAIGIGDYAYPEFGRPNSAALVARIAEIARDLGREVATPSEARAMLAINPSG